MNDLHVSPAQWRRSPGRILLGALAARLGRRARRVDQGSGDVVGDLRHQLVGGAVGLVLGVTVGFAEGATDGVCVGATEGAMVGGAVGAAETGQIPVSENSWRT